ncbi:hypothetical protein BRC2024_RHHMPPRL_CDS_0058 [Acinetobacter phage vB_AbaP_ABW311]
MKGSLPPNPSRLLPHTTFLEEFLGTLLSRFLIKVLITESIHSLDIHIASCSELLCMERLEQSYRYSYRSIPYQPYGTHLINYLISCLHLS